MRIYALGSFALFLVLASPALAETTLEQRIAPLLKEHDGEAAVAVKHLKSGESYVHRADVPMPTASLIKLPIMVEAYRQSAEGKVDLAEKVMLRDADKVPGSGILTQHFSEGATFSLRDAIRLMIAYSDNTATNLVLGKISLPATNETMEKTLGLPHTKIHALVFRPQSSILPERSKEFGLGSTTASEMIALLEQIESGKLVSAAACDEMLEHLRACQDKRVPRLLPAGTKVAHKTGSVASVRTAAAIVEASSGPIALCVLTRNNADQRWSDENAAEVLTSKIVRAAYDHFEASTLVAAASDEKVLKRGSTGRLVEDLQRALNARMNPSPELTVDGDFGPLTEAALKAFQRSKSLRATGETNAETWKALEEQEPGTSGHEPESKSE